MANTTKSPPPSSKGRKAATAVSKKRTSKRAPLGLRREIWGSVFAVLCLISFIAVLRLNGFILDAYFCFFSSLIGFGIYVLPLSFAISSVIWFLNTKGRIALRTTCSFLVPLLVGAIVHCIYVGRTLKVDMQVISHLLKTGKGLESGGLLSGGLSVLMMEAFSSIGGLLILIVTFLVALLVILKLTPMALIDKMILRESSKHQIEDDDREYEKLRPQKPAVEASLVKSRNKGKPKIDIPIDGYESKTEDIDKRFVKTPYVSSQDRSGLEDQAKDQLDEAREQFADLVSGKSPTVNQSLPEEQDGFEDDPLKIMKSAAGRLVISDISKPIIDEISESQDLDRQSDASSVDTGNSCEIFPINKVSSGKYIYPPITLLCAHRSTVKDTTEELRESSERLLDTLSSFNIKAEIINIIRGPSVTRLELQLPRGVKFSKITSLSDDIALSLGAVGVRIAPIPDKIAVGVEVPNKTVQMVFMREVIGSYEFKDSKSRLTFSIGKDITGSSVVGDIAKMPHMLIAGTTGSGKSVCINSLLISLLYKSSPEDVKLIMIDPKMIELGIYNGIPHLLIPVVTDPRKASGALNWAVSEMMRRYKLFSERNVRDLASYNSAVQKANQAANDNYNPDDDAPLEVFETLPQIVIVIDELSDLMMVAAREVEEAVCRIAQMARAAGMHLVIATQRPSADVITGIMKANIPSRIAFAVASQIESRIILDQSGAEKLIGKGDMLYSPLGISKPTRVQGCFISSEEVEKVVEFVKQNNSTDYNEQVISEIEQQAENIGKNDGSSGSYSDDSDDEDDLLYEAVDIFVSCNAGASVSMLQRKLKLGYSRAARIVDQMEERGIVGASEGSKPRQVLISYEDWQEMKMRRSI